MPRKKKPLELCKQLCQNVEEVREPDPWPTDEEGDDEVFAAAPQAAEVGEKLIEGLEILRPLKRFSIDYLFRKKETWESKGRTVLGQMRKPSGLLRKYADVDYIVLLNWSAWGMMSPMQRVALVYHELRHGTSKGGIQGHDFEGFFDELALFGTDTYRDWNLLGKAVDLGQDVQHQYSLELSVLDLPPTAEDGEEAATDGPAVH